VDGVDDDQDAVQLVALAHALVHEEGLGPGAGRRGRWLSSMLPSGSTSWPRSHARLRAAAEGFSQHPSR
jgi:hypothetical protein